MRPEDMLSRRQFGNREELADKVTPETVRNWIRQGIIRETKIGGTSYIHVRELAKARAFQEGGHRP